MTEITDAPRCHQSPPRFARPFSEVQRQFLRGWWLPGRADRRQGHALRAPDSELTTSVPGPRTRVPPHWAKQRGGCHAVCPNSGSARCPGGRRVRRDRLGHRGSRRVRGRHGRAGDGPVLRRARQGRDRGDDRLAAQEQGHRGRHRAGRRRTRRCPAGRGPDRGGDHLPAGEEPAVPVRRRRRQGRPVRCVRASGHAAHGPGPAAAADPRYARDDLAADGGTGPPGPGGAPGGGRQPAARAPGRGVPRRGQAVPRPGQPDQPGVPGPVRQPGRRRGAGRAGDRRVAGDHRGARPPGPGQRAVRAAARRAARCHRRTGRRPGRRHRRPDRHADHAVRPDQGPGNPDRRAAGRPTPTGTSSPPCPGPEPCAPPGCSPRSATAGPASPTPNRSPGWPGSRRSPAGPAPASPTASGGRSTASSATPFCDFAADSRHASPWAAAIYDNARARGKDHPHAVRITARAWIYVIWRCWHDGTAYDPAKHNALQAVLARQDAQAAGTAPQEDQ